MEQIYLDNGATSYPKAPGVGERMASFIQDFGVSVNRSSYEKSQDVAMVVLGVREKLCKLFQLKSPDHVVLIPGNTYGLNQVIYGLLEQKDHCLTTSMEHNAVARPLHNLEKQGITYDKMPCDADGYVNLELVEAMIKPNTKLMVIAHGSNVSGAVQPVEKLGEICKKHGIFLCVDGAQTAGHLPIDFEKMHLSALTVPGHKGLMGPSGIGALLLGKDMAKRLKPLVFGGTGSISDSLEMPTYMPDKFEPGTPNLPGIFGLDASLDFLEQVGVENIRKHDVKLTEFFHEKLSKIPNIRVINSGNRPRVGVISVDFLGRDNGEMADRLEQEFGILTRCGLHCAPWAHQSLGTFPQGTVRFSLGYFTTLFELEQAAKAVEKLALET